MTTIPTQGARARRRERPLTRFGSGLARSATSPLKGTSGTPVPPNMGDTCKICRGASLARFAHTAKCNDCGVLLYYPYPTEVPRLEAKDARQATLSWYSQSSFYSHANLTAMVRFAMADDEKARPLRVLDYGGGGGQFALICKSHFPQASVYITDICDAALLDEWRSANIQIPFERFASDETAFDYIFMNDVFEHVSDPSSVLKQLHEKLAPEGKLVIDTPKQFWIYPLSQLISKSLYAKVLRGTVSTAHLQIWSRRSFRLIVQECGFRPVKHSELSAYTMPADYYLRNMGIDSTILRLLGRAFRANANWLAQNKIVCVLEAVARTR